MTPIWLPTDKSNNFSPTVQHILDNITAELGKAIYSFDDLVGYVERARGKTLRLEEDKMPTGMTGYAIALKDCDLIATKSGLSDTQKLTVRLHEMAHFVKGDIPPLSRGERTSSYEQFIRRRDRHSIVVSRQRFFDHYTNPKERDAEILARIFLQIVLSQEKETPQMTRELRGV